jgi:hypothetical protein
VSFALSFNIETKPPSTRLYDVAGRLAEPLVEYVREAVSYEERWNGTNNRGAWVASGVYLHHLSTNDYKATRKMVILI